MFGFEVYCELNSGLSVRNCARGSATGIRMCAERAEGLLDLEIVRGAGSCVRRLRTWVADDQQGSSRLLATQGDACSGRRPTLTGDGMTIGEEPTVVEGGEGQSSMRVLSAGRELPGNYHIWFPKTQFEVSHRGESRQSLITCYFLGIR